MAPALLYLPLSMADTCICGAVTSDKQSGEREENVSIY
jgi:hypothetical protein